MKYNYNYFWSNIIMILFLFIYGIIKWKKNTQKAHLKFRYGTIISSIIMASPFIFALKPPILVEKLQELFEFSNQTIDFILPAVSFLIFTIVIKFIYVPINKDKD